MLQNLYCLQQLDNIIGTSAIGAVQLMHRIARKAGSPCFKSASDLWGAPLQPTVNPEALLIGTHAHELQSVTQQMLHQLDYEAGGGSPVCISSLASHLLFLASNGGLKTGTALADTFGACHPLCCGPPLPCTFPSAARLDCGRIPCLAGTKAFVELAMAADVPSEFIEDMAKMGTEPPIPPGERLPPHLRPAAASRFSSWLHFPGPIFPALWNEGPAY